jgi:hypothetical protein
VKLQIAWNASAGAQFYRVDWQCKCGDGTIEEKSLSQVFGTECEIDLCDVEGPWTVRVIAVNWAGESKPATMFQVKIAPGPDGKPQLMWLGDSDTTFFVEHCDRLTGVWETVVEGFEGEGLVTRPVEEPGFFRVRAQSEYPEAAG